MTFIRYRNRRSIASSPAPMVGLHSGHRLAVNLPALRVMGVSTDAPFVMLHFDPQMGQVALSPARDQHDLIDAVRLNMTEYVPHVKVTRFARDMGIEWAEARGNYPLTPDESLGLWLVQLPRGSWRRGESDIAPVTAMKRRAS